MRLNPLAAALSATVLLAPSLPVPASAQGGPNAVGTAGGLTLQQVERKYPSMNEVHILKCDRNADGLFNRTEMACVQGIYQAMYVDNR